MRDRLERIYLGPLPVRPRLTRIAKLPSEPCCCGRHPEGERIHLANGTTRVVDPSSEDWNYICTICQGRIHWRKEEAK